MTDAKFGTRAEWLAADPVRAARFLAREAEDEEQARLDAMFVEKLKAQQQRNQAKKAAEEVRTQASDEHQRCGAEEAVAADVSREKAAEDLQNEEEELRNTREAAAAESLKKGAEELINVEEERRQAEQAAAAEARKNAEEDEARHQGDEAAATEARKKVEEFQ